MSEKKKTPLFPEYEKLGAKMVDFGGWELPVQFNGIIHEHHVTRTKAGLFDVSHMGDIEVKGEKALPFLQTMTTNDLAKLKPGRAQYTIMCREHGGTIDDFIVYMLAENHYLLVVNAANTDKDYQWLKDHQMEGVTIDNVTKNYVQLALQGPLAEEILQSITETDLQQIRFFRFENPAYFSGIEAGAIVSRTGYTGEDGFEIYIDADYGRSLWQLILDAGEAYGIEPIGLGARDTLRFEVNLALYGQELSEDISPIEAGLSFAVKVKKDENFIGKQALQEQKKLGTNRKLVGIEMLDKGIPRYGYSVWADDCEIGFVTSGTQSPTLQKNVGLALLETDQTVIGTEVQVQVRKRMLRALVVETPFYKREQ